MGKVEIDPVWVDGYLFCRITNDIWLCTSRSFLTPKYRACGNLHMSSPALFIYSVGKMEFHGGMGLSDALELP